MAFLAPLFLTLATLVGVPLAVALHPWPRWREALIVATRAAVQASAIARSITAMRASLPTS